MVVARGSIRQEETFLPILIAAHHVLIESIVTSALCIVFETVQNVCGMEVVDPVQVRFSPYHQEPSGRWYWAVYCIAFCATARYSSLCVCK